MQDQRHCVNCGLLQNHRFKFCSHCGNQVEKLSSRLSSETHYAYVAAVDHLTTALSKHADQQYQPQHHVDEAGYVVYQNNPLQRPMPQHIQALQGHAEFLAKVKKATKPFTFFVVPLVFIGWMLYVLEGFTRVNQYFGLGITAFVVHAAVMAGIWFGSGFYTDYIDKLFRSKIGKHYPNKNDDYADKQLSYQQKYLNLENIYSQKGKLKCVYCGHAGTYVKGAYHGKYNSTAGYVSCSRCSEILYYT